MSSLPLRVLGDRVLVKPDRLDRAPETLDSGVVLATTLAAAVTGEDATQSVTRGTVMAVGNPKHPQTDEARAHAEWLDDQGDQHIEIAALLRALVVREPCCAVGDDVLFAYDAGQAITVEGETYLLLHETDLLAVVEPEKEPTHG